MTNLQRGKASNSCLYIEGVVFYAREEASGGFQERLWHIPLENVPHPSPYMLEVLLCSPHLQLLTFGKHHVIHDLNA